MDIALMSAAGKRIYSAILHMPETYMTGEALVRYIQGEILDLYQEDRHIRAFLVKLYYANILSYDYEKHMYHLK